MKLENDIPTENDELCDPNAATSYEQLLTKISKSSIWYRWIITILLGAVAMKSAFNIFVLTLSTASVPFHCAEVILDDTVVPWSQLSDNLTSQVNSTDYQCVRPRLQTVEDVGVVEIPTASNLSDTKCATWNFLPDRPDRYTLLMEHSMVCDRAYLANRMQTIMQIGTLIATVTGPLGDMCGRKTLLVIFAFIDIICNLLMIFINNLTAHMILLFIMGSISQSVVAMVVLQTELVSESYRGVHGNMIWTLWIVGYSGSAAVSYFIPTWKWQFAFCIALTACCYVTYIPFIPESPRWLLLTGRKSRAERVIREMCRFSGCRNVADTFDFDNNDVRNESAGLKHTIIPKDKIFSAKFLITLLIVSLNSFSCALVYFALSFQRDFISDDPYINIAISGILELPACILAWQLTNRAGRKYSILALFQLCGIGLLVLPFIPSGLGFPLGSIIAIAIKFSITAGFSTIDVYTAELIPTTVRSVSFFFASLVMRSAQMIAPELGGLLALLYKQLPILFYGGITCLLAALFIFLPETKGYDMPNTVDDMPDVGICINRKRRGAKREVIRQDTERLRFKNQQEFRE